MTTEYSRSVLKMVVAQICQTIGWNSINSTPMEFMVDLMQEYILKVSKVTQQYAHVLGRSEANLDDLGLAFRQLNIDLNELAEYVKNVDSVPCVLAVPKLPIRKESHLNFLKPGSREVVTRPFHVHEHLPAMYPDAEEEYSPEVKQEQVENVDLITENTINSEEESSENNNVINVNGTFSDDSPSKVPAQTVFKRPGDPVSFDGPVVKRPKTEGHPLREIHSVMMTTSGFLSTAREGKLPEARTPHQAHESPPPSSPSPPPIPQPYPVVPPEVKVEKKLKRIPKKTVIGEDGKPENKENKKKKIPKDNLFQPDEKVKKLVGMKEMAKLKVLKPGSKLASNLAGPSNTLSGKLQGKMTDGSPKHKNALSKVKSEKVNNLENDISPLDDHKEDIVDKLPIEPDKQKLNIFKKISSKSKEDKDKDVFDSPKLKQFNSQENSPIVMDHVERHDVKHEDKISNMHHSMMNNNRVPGSDVNVMNMMSPGSDVYMFDDMSPPGTPSTPKTPELSVPNINIEPQKKKKKDKTGKKKEPKLKNQRNPVSPKKPRWSNDSSEVTILERPKTPQAPENPMSRDVMNPMAMPFLPTASGPGLIPPPMFPMPIPGKGIPMMPGGPPNPAAVMSNMMRPRFPPFPTGPGLIPPMYPMAMHKGMMGPGGAANPAAGLPAQMRPPFMPPPVPGPGLIPPMIMPNMIRPRFARPETPKLEESRPVQIASSPPPTPVPVTPTIPPITVPTSSAFPELVKTEKSEKKSKEHKKEKKDKMKKKKEKKEKHKDKGEKSEKKEKIKKDKLEKIKEKKEKKEKRKEKEARERIKEEKVMESVPKLTLKLGPAGGSPRPPTPDSAVPKKITIKPPKRPEDEAHREPTPELAKISALITRPPKQKSKTKADAVSKKEETKQEKENGGIAITPQSVTVNDKGEQIWICPGCGKKDDGSPMIGCDGCDAWYHWPCVGITVEPSADDQWFCPPCQPKMLKLKDVEQYHDKKKKKRKKKMKGSP